MHQPASPVVPAAPDVRPVSMQRVDRIASDVVTAVAPVMLGGGMWFGWAGSLFGWQDLLVPVICYVVIGTGVTVGFHRLLTRRSFSATGSCGPAWDVVRVDPCRRPRNATPRPRSPQPSVVE